jgi:hypothetical protein
MCIICYLNFKFWFWWMLGFWRLCFGFDWWINLNVRVWLSWVIDYLVDYGRFWWFWVMNCVNGKFWVRNLERTVDFLFKFWVGGWRWRKFILVPQFVKLQFSPQTLENYKLVPGAYSEILNRIKYELWAELQYIYEF